MGGWEQFPVCAYREEMNMPVNPKNGFSPTIPPIILPGQFRETIRNCSYTFQSLSRATP
jgi:hypothetical protein